MAKEGITLLQYFPNKHYHSTLQRNSMPQLEYVCNVDSDASRMPRSMHAHEHLFEIVLVVEGAGIYMVDGQRYVAKAGDLIFYNGRIVHDEYGGNGSALSTYCIAISGIQVPNLPPDHLLPRGYSPVQSTHEDFKYIKDLFLAIEREARTHAEVANYFTLALIAMLSAFIAEHGVTEEQRTPSLVTKARAFIDKNFKENIRLNDIAAATHTNAYYLSHLFKDEVGLSPMKYVILRRIGEAQNLLINTDMTITQIAAQVGYNNSNYFQNVFKSALTMTPLEYRKRWTV